MDVFLYKSQESRDRGLSYGAIARLLYKRFGRSWDVSSVELYSRGEGREKTSLSQDQSQIVVENLKQRARTDCREEGEKDRGHAAAAESLDKLGHRLVGAYNPE
jgi:hypothetical protein